MIFAALALLTMAVLLNAIRLVRGPTDSDRIIAADILLICAVAFCALAARMTGRDAFLDVGMGTALIGFVATLAWARLVDMRARAPRDEGNPS